MVTLIPLDLLARKYARKLSASENLVFYSIGEKEHIINHNGQKT